MSRRDVEEYYNLITNDYKEMVNTLKEMEELAAQDIVNPDKVDEVRRMVEPLKNNYQRISYIMFLLNQPNRKKKVERYVKSNEKFLANCDTSEHDENLKVISTVNCAWSNKEEE